MGRPLKRHDEPTPLRIIIQNLDLTMVKLRQSRHDRQAQSGPFNLLRTRFIRSKESIKDELFFFIFHPVALISHLKCDLLCGLSDLDRNGRLTRGIFMSIAQQRDHNLLNTILVSR